MGEPLVGNENQFFSANFASRSAIAAGPGLRPHIRVEMCFYAPSLKPIACPIRSLIAEAQRKPAEVAQFLCVDPIETAADKLSTLAWRVCARKRGAEGDGATLIRHLYDLAALKDRIAEAAEFQELARQTASGDTGRGGESVLANPEERFAAMIELLRTDKARASEYETFVLQVSVAKPNETISFTEACAATSKIVTLIWRS